jgi:CII-binding regulator of phage lambda lysogenization HflD
MNSETQMKMNMKKLMMGAVMLVMAVSAQAQSAEVTKFFSKYQDNAEFTQVTVSSKMFGLFTNMDVEKPEDKEILEAISKIKGLRVLAKDQARDSRELYKEALSIVPKDYEELMFVRDKDQDMKFLIKESGGKISELLMIAAGNDDFKMLSLFGEIDLKKVSRIGSRMNIDGLEHLRKMDKGDKGDKKKENDQE